jgi:glycosyltransferase 2 family protein
MLRDIVGLLAHARVTLVAAALALHLVGLIITGERWRVVIAAMGSRVSLARATLINLAGIFVRNATPTTGLGGDASRIALLRAEGVPLAQATASFAYVRLSEIAPLAVLVGLSAPAALSAVARSSALIAGAVVVIVVGLAVVWTSRGSLRGRILDLWQRTEHIRITRAAMLAAVFYATLAQIETVARLIVVAAAFGMTLTVQQAATVTVMSIVGGFVPTIGSIGAIDGSLVAGLMLFGASAEKAVAITLVGRAISYGVSTAAGALALAFLGGHGILRIFTEHKTNTAAAG